MNKPFQRALFLFRRDLRLDDNRGLSAATQHAHQVLACFIIDPRQVELHPYRSENAMWFLYESLKDLDRQLQSQNTRLNLIYGLPDHMLETLQQEHGIEAVFVNGDYTPFSRRRDEEIKLRCHQLGLQFFSFEDHVLNSPLKVSTSQGEPYRVFTAFFHRCRLPKPALPKALVASSWYSLAAEPDWSLIEQHLPEITEKAWQGGRDAARAHLANLDSCRDYTEKRDLPAEDQTSHLSAYLKFGCCSVREAYHAIAKQLGEDHALLRQLYWRDFFYHIAHHYPHVFGHAFQERYEDIKWNRDMNDFNRWSRGETGFPIVDAGMRQLNATGWMPNRVRMIVASFLCKDLHISWRWGERYFAQHLIDYDPCLNNGNWQWAASTGCDAQPYFRIFNPWTQQRKFDPDCHYIKRWLPELRAMPTDVIHDWATNADNSCGYPSPMLDHRAASDQAKALFQQAARQNKTVA